MENITTQERSVQKEDAHKRAIEDYSQFSQFAKFSAQLIFFANGSASIAMLSFLTNIVTTKTLNPNIDVQDIMTGFAVAASFYLLGLFSAICSTIFLSISKQYWGHFWEDIALNGVVDFGHPYSRRGEITNKFGFIFLICGLIGFVPGSIFAVKAFLI